MGAKYSEAQNRATNKYRSVRTQIGITIDTEMADRWKAMAEAEGLSLTKWIIKEIEEREENECMNLTVKIFGALLPDTYEKPIKELKKLKVYLVMNDDEIESFSDVWFRVQHEVDMYEEGEESNELSFQSYIGACNWLDRWEHLYEG